MLNANFTSPRTTIEWLGPNKQIFRTKVPRYDSIHGAQYGMLPLNLTSSGEWTVSVSLVDDDNVSKVLASANFVVFPYDGRELSPHIVEKYFNVLALCSENGVMSLPVCKNTSWSHSSPDPKARFFY